MRLRHLDHAPPMHRLVVMARLAPQQRLQPEAEPAARVGLLPHELRGGELLEEQLVLRRERLRHLAVSWVVSWGVE